MTAVLIDTELQDWRETLADAVAEGRLSFKIRGNLLDFLRDAPSDTQMKIAELDCSSLEVRDTDATALAGAAHLGNLTTLNLYGNEIGPEGATALAGAAHLGKLTTLDLGFNFIGRDGAMALAGAAHLRNLIMLFLGVNGIGLDGATALFGAAHLRNLTTLNLGGNKIGPKGATALAESAHLGNLNTLNLNSNFIGPDGAMALAGTAYLTNLTTLALVDNGIGDAGAMALAEAAHLGNLTTLALGSNKISDAGATALAEAVHLGKLIKLFLGGNKIGPEGATALAGAAHLTNLTTLDLGSTEYLGGNMIGPEGATALAGAAHLGNLTTLDLGFNEIGDAGATALARSAHLCKLTTLDLCFNGIGHVGATALAGAAHLGNLTDLDLGSNDIDDAGATALAGAAHLGKLTMLNLGSNNIGEAGAAAILLSPQLLRLEQCKLDSNSLTAPQNIQNDVGALRRHYRLSKAARRVPNTRVRALLLGAPAAGKSRLFRLLAEAPETAVTRTLGFDRNSRPYPSIVCEVEGQQGLHDLDLDIWDMGGQSLQQMMHGLFLRQSQINLLVMRDASERDAARTWLDQLVQQTTNGNSDFAALVPVINGFPHDNQTQMRETKAAFDKLLEHHGSRLSVQPATAITTISTQNGDLTLKVLDNAIVAALTANRLPTYFEPVARLRPLIEFGLAEPCYDLRELRRLLLANPSFQQEHGLLTAALLAAEGASSEPIPAEQFASMLMTYLEQAGVVAVFRRDGDGIYDGLVVRDALWIQKGLYSLLPPMALEEDEASPERDAFAASMRSTSARMHLPGVFTEDDIRPVWKSLEIAEADQALLLNILARKELGQLIRLDDAAYDGSCRYFVPAYLEEIGTETPTETLDRLANSLTKANFASCWCLPKEVHWPAYFIYRLMVTIHGTPVHAIDREHGWSAEKKFAPFIFKEYAQARCIVLHDELLSGEDILIVFADDKLWCLAMPAGRTDPRRDYEPAFQAVGRLIETALGNALRPSPKVIRSLLCPSCIADLAAEHDPTLRHSTLLKLGMFDFGEVTENWLVPTLICKRHHKHWRADILEFRAAAPGPAIKNADPATVRRAVMQIALFLYLGGMARRGTESIEAVHAASNNIPYLTIGNSNGVAGTDADGIVYTSKFVRDWVATDEKVRIGDPKLIIGWCRYLARNSTMFRLICKIAAADELSEVDLGSAVIEGAKRVCAKPAEFVDLWVSEIGKGLQPTPARRLGAVFLKALQANPDFDPIMAHFALQSVAPRPQRKEARRVESKPREPKKPKP